MNIMIQFLRRLFMVRVEFVDIGSDKKERGYLVTYTQVVTSYTITAGKAIILDGQMMAVIEPEKRNVAGEMVHKAIPANRVSIL